MPCLRRSEPRRCLGSEPVGMALRYGHESPTRRARSHRSRRAVRSSGAADVDETSGILTPKAPPTGESCRFEPKRGRADDQRRLLAA